jgi:small multidrug resistance family-3 protein
MPLRPLALFFAAAMCEIAGCFSFWAVFRLHRLWLWLVPGAAALLVFAWFLSQVEAPFAGRVYAAYGGVYILASLGWLTIVERAMPDRWDLLGVAICLLGAGVILWGPR